MLLADRGYDADWIRAKEDVDGRAFARRRVSATALLFAATGRRRDKPGHDR
jgi:hypothetical protein